MKTPRFLLPAASLALFLPALQAADFEKDVLPILDGRCGRCHLNGNSKGNLQLDADQIEGEIGRGKPIVPGSLTSELLQRITLPETDEDRMPPKGRPLSEQEVNTIKEWIAAGAPLEGEGTKMAEAEEAPDAPKKPEPISGQWTNTAGKSITATLLRVEGDKAILQLPNAKIYPYPIANLSPESQAKVKAFAEASSQ